MGSWNPTLDYTVVSVTTQGLSEDFAQQLFASAGAVYARKTFTAVAGKNSGSGWLVAVASPFIFHRHMESEGYIAGIDSQVMYHGKLGEYFCNQRAVADPSERAARASARVFNWRVKHDPFMPKEDKAAGAMPGIA